MNLVIKLKKRFVDFKVDLRVFGLFIAFTNFIWPIIPRMPYFIASYIMIKKHNRVSEYIVEKCRKVIEKYHDESIIKEYTPKLPIWFCWLQGSEKMPEVPQECLKSVNKYSGEHPVIIITLKNYHNYISLPTDILNLYNQGQISNAHFTDIIRTSLLAEKGGCWIDSTVLVTKKISEEIFKFPFYSIKYANSGYYITENMWSNFFLVSQKKSIFFMFVRDMFFEYLRNENRFVDYFMMDYFIKIGYNTIPEFKNAIDCVPYNNIRTLQLKTILNDEHSNEKLNFLTKETYLFKLNWRHNYRFSKNGKRTNWGVLIN